MEAIFENASFNTYVSLRQVFKKELGVFVKIRSIDQIQIRSRFIKDFKSGELFYRGFNDIRNTK